MRKTFAANVMARRFCLSASFVVLCAALARCSTSNGDSGPQIFDDPPVADGQGGHSGKGGAASGGSAGAVDGSVGAQDGSDGLDGSAAGGGGQGGGDSKSCEATMSCDQASDLGAVQGDTGSDLLNARGTTAGFYSIMVNEADGGVFAASQKLTVELYPTEGLNFDLYLYGDISSNGTPTTSDCTTVVGSSTNSGSQPDRVSVTWGELVTGNSSDDSRRIDIEVRDVSGTCSNASAWSMVIRGDYYMASP